MESKVWDVRLLYDGECPLCVKEINMLKRRDEGQDKISFVNIATPEYDPEDYEGITYGKVCHICHSLVVIATSEGHGSNSRIAA